MSHVTLPPLPVDDAALDLYWLALHPGPEAKRSSLSDLLAWLSEMAGSDLTAVEGYEGEWEIMRDPKYHPNHLISALIVEVRRLRAASKSEGRDE